MSYQSEAALEQQFIEQLNKQGYNPVSIPDYDALLENFKIQFAAFNAAKLDHPLTDKEWERVFNIMLGKSVFQSAKILRDKFVLEREDGTNDKGQAAARKKQAAELKKIEKRKAEVDTLFARMYEDWAAGRITEYNFSMLSGKYQSEQAELDEKIERLQSAIATESQNAADAEKWIALMKECVNPTELTAELLNTLIEKIVVHEAVKGEDGSREQEVEIFYRFIGKID